MAPSSLSLNWRDELHQSFEQVLQAVASEIEAAKANARAEGARETSEGINQALRRLRGAADEDELLALLVEAAAVYGRRTAGIALDEGQARMTHVSGFESAGFELGQAAAALSAIDTKDPVVAAGTETELSPSLFQAAMRDLEVSERAYFFPLVTAGSVRALLFAAGGVRAAPIEALSEAAALRWELFDAEARARPKMHTQASEPLVNITAQKIPMAWTELPPHEQALHLKAQRFAKVKVAEMRLSKPGAVRRGQESGDLYKELKPEIDSARDAFRKDFVDANPGMVDYLYLEIVRSLANDDDRLLGSDFPGLLA